MQITMQHAEHLTLAQMREFLSASSSLSFAAAGRRQIYALIERVLRTQKYLGLTKKDKGIVRGYLVKISGLSKAQITRLIARWRDCGVIQQRVSRRHRFPTRYTPGDIQLLAKVDGAHEGLSGPAVRRILQREFEVHGLAPYERLAAISASHIYNLRRSRTYREQRIHHTKTRASAVNIGERRKPDPRGEPGHLRVDTVHQGDTPKGKGLYHINAVDTVTQWEIVGCCETISEAHLLPVLEAILHQFPFQIRGFHSDNGSEFLNYKVEKLLNKLLVKFTKSRANRTTDNFGGRQKGGAQTIGHAAIAAHHADQVQRFYTADFNLFELPPPLRIRHHRCERQRQTPPPLSAQRLPHAVRKAGLTQGLGPSITAAYLEQQARKMSDTECALACSTARENCSTPAARGSKARATAQRQAGPRPRTYIEGRGKGKRKKSSCWRQERAPLPPINPPPLSNTSILSSPCRRPFSVLTDFRLTWIGKCSPHDDDLTLI